MAKITGSRNRYKRKRSKNPTSSTNRPQRSKASSNSKNVTSSGGGTKGSAKVTQGQGGQRAKVKIKPKSTGLIGTRNTPATKTTYTGPKTPGVKFNPANRVKVKPGGGVGGVVAAGATALTSAVIKNQADLKQQRKDSKYNQGAAYRAQQKKLPKVKMPSAAPTKASKPAKKVNTPKPKSKPSVAPSKPRSESLKYKPSTKRTDKMSKVVAELKAMQKRSRKRQGK